MCRVHHAKSGLDEAQAGIKIAWRNINDLRYADDTTLMGCCSPWGHTDSETTETVTDFILGGSRITADGDCSHEI